ncbi:MAG: sodium/solute symporter, partial [Chitinivibrionales bacterium]|nr:sodium/solute symporter [Chitinivibrionales bacterium]
MDTPILQGLDYGVIGLYIVALISLGIWIGYSKRESQDLFLGGRSFGWFGVGASIFATNIVPGFLTVTTMSGYKYGLVGANMEWLAWIFLLLLCMVFIPHYLTIKIPTMPQFLKRRYGPGAYNFMSFYAIFGIVFMWTAGNLYIGGLFLSQITNWPLWTCSAILAIIAVTITMAGGLASVIITDTFQTIIMIIGSTIVTIIVFNHVGGIKELVDNTPEHYWKLFRSGEGVNYPWYSIVFGYPVMAIWFWCTDQTIVQRVLGAKSIREGQLGTVFTGFLKILPPMIWLLPGIMCYVLHPNLADPDKAFVTILQHHVPVGLTGLMIAIFMAMLISTLDSALNSFSTIFTLDIYARFIKPDATEKQQRNIGRIMIFLAAFFAFLGAIFFESLKENLFDLCNMLNTWTAPALAATFLMGVLWKKSNGRAA